jgi:hypothetical protein
MQVKFEGLVQAEVNDERRSRHNAQTQLHVEITNIQREIVGLLKTTNWRVDLLESTVNNINHENIRRTAHKNRPFYKKAFGLHADAAALPALLAELKAAE